MVGHSPADMPPNVAVSPMAEDAEVAVAADLTLEEAWHLSHVVVKSKMASPRTLTTGIVTMRMRGNDSSSVLELD